MQKQKLPKRIQWLVLCLVTLVALSAIQMARASELCDQVGELAKSTIEAKQSGVTLRAMMNMLDEKIAQDNPAYNMTKIVITMAYDTPNYSSAEMIRKQAVEFENQIYAICLAQN